MAKKTGRKQASKKEVPKTKTIAVSLELHELLKSKGYFGDTVDMIIRRELGFKAEKGNLKKR